MGGQLWPAIQFVATHPSALVYVLLLSGVSTAVQLFIFYTIQQYGALHFALIMTIRQFLSIILSCLVFSHDLSPSQWIGTSLVIGGLLARGMHRGGLERTSMKGRSPHAAISNSSGGSGSHPSSMLRRTSSNSQSAAKALLLPLTTIPVVRHSGPEAATAAGPLDAAAAAKKDAGAIAVDVQAGSLASGVQHGAASTRARSPTAANGKGAASVAMRRKALDLG